MDIAIYAHEESLEHDPGQHHPENAGRLNAIMAALKESDLHSGFTYKKAPLAKSRQILLAHSQSHLDTINNNAPTSGQVNLDGDTVMSKGSLNAALRGVGAACQAVDDIMADTVNSAFCATRPPGHHATPNQAMGFCIFNNIAVAALYAQSTYQLERVAIVDFDVHHGNGTQDIMSGKTGVLYISTHQSPLYPGSGQVSDNISENILNVPLPANTNHHDYLTVFESEVIPALNAYQPQLILVSAGFDAHIQDPLAGLDLNEDTYFWLGQQLRQLALQHCQGRLISVLEGGYNQSVLGPSVLAYLQGIAKQA